MTLLIVAACLLLLILLIAVAKFHPFLSFIIVSLLAGWWLGIPVDQLTSSVKTGVGSMLGDLVIIVCAGAMLGKLVAETGAAQKIANTLLSVFGEKHLQWTMMVTGFVVGIPLFYNVGFVLLVPLAFSIIYSTGKPAVYIALPMLAALSVTHGFLPPHPSPLALTAQLKAETGKVLLYGIIVAIPAILIAGPLFSQTLKKLKTPALQLFKPKLLAENELPGAFNSFFTALLPALLLMVLSAVLYLPGSDTETKKWLSFLADPVIVLLISLLYATVSLGILQKHTLKKIMDYYGDAVKDISVILLIIAGAGALKQVLTDSGVSKDIGNYLQGLSVHPLILGWMIAALVRVCVGSATVAGLTAAGIIAPLVAQLSFNPHLMVLSIGAGSLMFSHVNDSGFWMFKEYFNLSVKDTLRTWSVMETIVSVMGLLGVLALNLVV
ncbi:MAG: gluconate transporter [Chitinophagaceae bacterium]|nr:gluconate transporter [Chitinophagaceae bacterium]